MPENTFDVVSKVDLQEVSNAIQQAMKEVTTRFDLKDSKSKIDMEVKGLTYSAVEPAAGGTAKQKITLQQGIAIEKARDIVKLIKDSKKKVQASIQGDLVRISGKDRDTLQEVIALLKSRDFGIDLQFTNYRSN
jgi:uncharacterized protein YajQ (UPF0234 family)